MKSHIQGACELISNEGSTFQRELIPFDRNQAPLGQVGLVFFFTSLYNFSLFGSCKYSFPSQHTPVGQGSPFAESLDMLLHCIKPSSCLQRCDPSPYKSPTILKRWLHVNTDFSLDFEENTVGLMHFENPLISGTCNED